MLSHTAPFESQSGKRKSSLLATHFDSLPDNSRTSPDVCFVTNLRLPHHTKLRLLQRLCVIPALAVSANFSVLSYQTFAVQKEMSARGQKRTTALVIGLEQNGVGAMTTAFAGESVLRPA
jgi:hypothetical protein